MSLPLFKEANGVTFVFDKPRLLSSLPTANLDNQIVAFRAQLLKMFYSTMHLNVANR